MGNKLACADQVITVAKKIETVNSLDKVGGELVSKAGGLAAYKMRTPKEKAEDAMQLYGMLQEIAPDACKEVETVLVEWIKLLNEDAVGVHNYLKERITKLVQNDPGSKVKTGRFADCSVIYAGEWSYIYIPNDILGGVELYLTSECVKSCTYDRKKYKLKLGHHHYYFSIEFTDGTRSYIRVSRKHLKNMKKCGATNIPADVLGEDE